ncbi:oligosaccharide flippase family protein [bacterium]|nr:oligosaccharide flippase family protein [bacterium]
MEYKGMKLMGSFERQATFIFIASTLSNIGAYFFHAYMGRRLFPADYGILCSLLALLMMVSVPAGTIQTVITKYVSHFKAHNQQGKVRFLFFHSLKRISLYGGIGFLIFLAFSGQIARFQQIPSRLPVVILGFILLFSVVAPAVSGIVQGLQRFNYLGWGMIGGTFLRLISGIILVIVGFGVNGALGASIIGMLSGLFILCLPLRSLLQEKTNERVADSRGPAPHQRCLSTSSLTRGVEFKEIYRYSAPVTLALLYFVILTNVDVVLVKHFFSPLEAGNYSAAATVGRIILYFPMSIVIVMFPKAAELYAQRKDSSLILKKSLLYVSLLAGGATLIFFLFPRLPLGLLYGDRFQASTPLVGKFALAMTFFSLVNIFFFYQLSIHRFRFLYLACAFTLLQIIAITLFHNTLSQVVWILVVNGALLFLINQFLVWMPRRVPLKAQKTTEDTEKIL